MELKVLLWNLRGFKNKREELSNRIREFDIGIPSEIKIKKGYMIKINGYNAIWQEGKMERGTARGGVAILIKKGIKYKILKGLEGDRSDIEKIGIRVEYKGKKVINIVGIYRKPGNICRKGEWKQISEVKKRGEELLIAGDFNSHNHIWNCEETDRNGQILEEEMEEMEMYVVNDDTKSRIGEGGKRDANLDLIFCSEGLVNKIRYVQEEDSWGSDHFPISVEIGIEKKVYSKIGGRLSNKCTDWVKYKNIIEKEREMIKSREFKECNVFTKYNKLMELMINSVKLASGKELKKGNQKDRNIVRKNGKV